MLDTPEQNCLMYPRDSMYCIFLHVLEGKNLMLPAEDTIKINQGQISHVIFKASLNGIKFELTGSGGPDATIFNSNCIWECELEAIKRMKSDNRPVKIECFTSIGQALNASRTSIGSLLLPIRGIPPVSNLKNLKFHLIWHKLGNLTPQWRDRKPRVQVMLTIINRSFVKSGQFLMLLGKRKEYCNSDDDPMLSETNCMLYSQKGVFVELCSHIGLIQIGNNPALDADIFKISVTFLSLKRIHAMMQQESAIMGGKPVTCIFKYDFLGSISQTEIYDSSDNTKNIKERITMTLKSSVKSIKLYFQRVFYLPLTLLIDRQLVAQHRMDFSKYLPESDFFNSRTFYSKKGSFAFESSGQISFGSQVPKPIVEFEFCMELLQHNPKMSKLLLQSNNGLMAPTLPLQMENNNLMKQCLSQQDTQLQVSDGSKSTASLMEHLNYIDNGLDSNQTTDDKIVPSLHLTDMSVSSFVMSNDTYHNYTTEMDETSYEQQLENNETTDRTPTNSVVQNENKGFHCPVFKNKQLKQKFDNNCNTRSSTISFSYNNDRTSNSVALSDYHASIEDFKSSTSKLSINCKNNTNNRSCSTEFVKHNNAGQQKQMSIENFQQNQAHFNRPLYENGEETVPVKVHRSNKDQIYTTIAFGKNNANLRYSKDTEQMAALKIPFNVNSQESIKRQDSRISAQIQTKNTLIKDGGFLNSHESLKKTTMESNDNKSNHTFFVDKAIEQNADNQTVFSQNNNQNNQNPDFIAEKVVEELEIWKKEQMQVFLKEMEEEQKRSKENRQRLEAVLEEKICTCETLNKQLEETYNEVKDASSAAKVNFEEQQKANSATYADRFFQLEKEVRYLKKDLEEKINLFGRLQDEKITENERLYSENVTLKKTIAKLETSLKDAEKLTMPPEQARNLLNKLRKKTQQLTDIETTKNNYKEQWMKSTRELNKLKQMVKKINKKPNYDSSDNENLENNNDWSKVDLQKILSDDVFYPKPTKKCATKNTKYVR